MSCNIVLENFQGRYYPGNTISGHLVCTFTSRESIRGIRVKLRGKEHTSWTETESYYDSHDKKTKYRTVHYSGDNKFLAVDLTLVGEKTMAPGRYEYPFTFTLPINLPPNFQGSYGHIKYFIKGTVDIPFAFDYENERNFDVHALVDFNEILSDLQLEPCTYQDEKTICCCCCASGPITMDVMMDKEAFIVGEAAKIKVEVKNLSNENIDQMSVKIKMVLEYKTTSPRTSHKYDDELVASDYDTGVGAHGERTYLFDLRIPSSSAIYNFRRCTLFKQWFVLKVEANIPGCHSNMEVETGVQIGHIPVRGTEQPTHQISHLPSSEIPGGVFPPPPPKHVPDNPPPYPSLDREPPYPTGPPAFPAPVGAVPGQIGFTLPPGSEIFSIPKLPTNGMMPVPVHGGARYPPGPSASTAANAPPEESAPSAPTKAEIAEEENFVLLDSEDPSRVSTEPPPPTYNDAVSVQPNVHSSGIYPPGTPPQSRPSAPQK
ncbi:arrestin domain-containing protein 3 isoform X1 [Leptinotarsa decemlineata]|uniref:arrestin domain-containing protein 3 isoform X1 n=1 Tax=Leptinotarsa decemlineata TaxID=7539 RepID=UPI003D30D5CE